VAGGHSAAARRGAPQAAAKACSSTRQLRKPAAPEALHGDMIDDVDDCKLRLGAPGYCGHGKAHGAVFWHLLMLLAVYVQTRLYVRRGYFYVARHPVAWHC
jgi:hypothetical protein